MRELALPLNFSQRFKNLKGVFFCTIAKHSYLKLLPFPEGSEKHKLLSTFLVDLWEAETVAVFLPALCMAFAIPLLSRLGWGLHKGPYIVRLLFYTVRGQALLAAYRNSRSGKWGSPVSSESRLTHQSTTSPASASAKGNTSSLPLTVDYLIIGSGAAGATAAKTLSELGKEVLIVEEGKYFDRSQFEPSTYSAMQRLFREQGMQMAHGNSYIPVLQASCVGGTTVINGAIIHPLPEKIYLNWVRDHGIDKAFSWQELEGVSRSLSADLRVKANLSEKLHDLPVANALNKLGWNFRAMTRNAPDCESSGRCLQGCPSGAKLSMENSFIPQAISLGAHLASEHKVEKILFDVGRASGVLARYNGETKVFRARKAVILAAGAVHTPWILYRSGVRNRHLGKHFQCHLGINSIAKLPRLAREIEGPPQGIEIMDFETEGYKLSSQLLPEELILCRTPLNGAEMIEALKQENIDTYSAWTASIRSKAEGYLTFGTKPKIYFEPTHEDLHSIESALIKLRTLFTTLGATAIYPSKMHLIDSNVESGRLNIRDYFLGVGHLFGTCRMGSEAESSMVDTHFRVRNYTNLFCIDASLFPTNIGVNPQHSIMCLAKIAALSI